jgi:hypothetical protein
MSVALNKTIAAKTSDIAKMERALKAHNDHINYLIGVLEQEIYDLNIKLQLAEMEEEDDEGWNSRPALLCRHTATYNSGPPHSPVVPPAPICNVLEAATVVPAAEVLAPLTMSVPAETVVAPEKVLLPERVVVPVPSLVTAPVPLIVVAPVVMRPPLAPVKVMGNVPVFSVVVPVIFNELITEAAN